jgi:hypothetical protein
LIALDEDLQKPAIAAALRRWYPGSVVAVSDLRLGTLVDDPDIPTLLRRHRGCTFVTINWADFWLNARPGRRFAIICVRVPQDRADEVPAIVRRLFQQSALRSQRERCGKVILATAETIRYYDRLGGDVHTLAWS